MCRGLFVYFVWVYGGYASVDCGDMGGISRRRIMVALYFMGVGPILDNWLFQRHGLFGEVYSMILRVVLTTLFVISGALCALLAVGTILGVIEWGFS